MEYLPYPLREQQVTVVIRFIDDQIRALDSSLPEGFPSLYPGLFGQLIFGQNNTMPGIDISADRYRLTAGFRMI